MNLPNRESCECYAVASIDDVRNSAKPGALFIDDDNDAIWLHTPDGSRLPWNLDPEITPVWQWDGNREWPTLAPSLLIYQTVHGERAERWHGWLRAGRLVSC